MNTVSVGVGAVPGDTVADLVSKIVIAQDSVGIRVTVGAAGGEERARSAGGGARRAG